MSETIGMPGPVMRFALAASPRSYLAVVPAVALIVASFFMLNTAFAKATLAGGVTLMLLAGLILYLRQRHLRSEAHLWAAVGTAAASDTAPVFGTDSIGVIQYRNAAAREAFGGEPGDLAAMFRDFFASAPTTLDDLIIAADRTGSAERVLPLSNGRMRLHVHRIAADGFVWRIDQTLGAEALTPEPQIDLPMMQIEPPHKIVNMNEAMRKLIGGQPTSLDRVVSRLPLVSGAPTVLQTKDGPADVHLAVIDGAEGGQTVYVWPETTPEVERTNADSIPVPLMRISANGRILMANARAKKLLALDSGTTHEFAEVIEGLGRPIEEWLRDVTEGRGTGRTQVVRAALPTNEVYLQVSLGRMVDRGEVSILAVLIDATELKTLEAQIVQSQKMQAIGQLAGGVAHDFNNLLTAISGHCDLLLLRHEPGDPNYGDLIQINQNANRAASLVGQLLAFSRKQNLQPEMIDLRETLVDLTHLLNRLVGEKIHLRWSHDPELPQVRADKRQLEQVIMNLVVNARDAMPAGGAINVETRATTLDEPLMRDRAEVPAGDYVMVKVLDEGCGIAPDRLQKIFEPFYSTKKTGEGTGLGLSMAYGIVKQSGGFIFADSAVGKGSTFTMYFPAHYQTAPVVARPAATSSKVIAPEEGGNILLVEDEAPVRAFASRALRLRGFTVTEAACAEDALDLLDDPNLDVDVFVTDVVMPGMDGPTWVSKALEARPDVKVVFMSGYAEDSVSHNRAKITNSVFLPKPFSLTQLTETVQSQIA
ncbi:MAG: ATP-binding protein [Pseudomonadota bacterium]